MQELKLELARMVPRREREGRKRRPEIHLNGKEVDAYSRQRLIKQVRLWGPG